MKVYINLSYFVNQTNNVYSRNPNFKLNKRKYIKLDNCLDFETKMGSCLGNIINFPSHIFEKNKIYSTLWYQ